MPFKKTEDIKEYSKKYREDNKEYFQKYRKEYYIKNKQYFQKYKKDRANTIDGFTEKLWGGLNSRTINGSHKNYKSKNNKIYLDNGVELRITKEQLLQKVTNNWEKILNMKNNKQIPSINRIGPSIHYELDNIEFIPLSKNNTYAGKFVYFISNNYPDLYIKLFNEYHKEAKEKIKI
jgi:hypothetical protein